LPEEDAYMSRADRGFALFLVIVLVVLVTLFYQLFPRQDPEGQAGEGGSTPAATPPAAQPK
jgi:hypothetical protein